MTVAVRGNAYHIMYEVLDEAYVTRWPPPGSRAALSAVLEALRADAAPIEHIDLVERVAVAFSRLECALRSHDGAAEDSVRAELRSVGARWLETPMGTRLH